VFLFLLQVLKNYEVFWVKIRLNILLTGITAQITTEPPEATEKVL